MRAAVALGGLLLIAGCGGGALEDREVDASSGELVYTASPVEYEGSDSVPWPNSGTQAVIDWSGTSLETGSVTLQLVDGSGKRLYEKAATAAGAPETMTTEAAGTTGDWEAVLIYRNATGRVALQIQGAR